MINLKRAKVLDHKNVEQAVLIDISINEDVAKAIGELESGSMEYAINDPEEVVALIDQDTQQRYVFIDTLQVRQSGKRITISAIKLR